MDNQLLLICLLTFSIHLTGALADAARIAGVRTGASPCRSRFSMFLSLYHDCPTAFSAHFWPNGLNRRVPPALARPCLANSELSCFRRLPPQLLVH